jgi:hypothetical protein
MTDVAGADLGGAAGLAPQFLFSIIPTFRSLAV